MSFLTGHITGHLTAKLQQLPNQTQLSLALVKPDHTNFVGLTKNEEIISPIDNRDAAFEIGSLTKPFTAYLLAQLLANGVVKLDDPIQRFLLFKLHRNPPITLGQLVSHTSGLPRLPGDFFTHPDYLEDNPYLNYDELRFLSYLTKKLELDNAPGERFNYSNLGFGVLSLVLNAITRKSFTSLLSKAVLEPLNMLNSGFERAAINASVVEGLTEEGYVAPYWDSGFLEGCIGMLSTVNDLSKFALSLLDFKNQASTLQLQEIADLRPDVKICMGWAKSTAQPPIYWHGGGTAGFGSIMTFNREAQTAVIILSNIAPANFKMVIEPYAFELLASASAENIL
jgi:CubicO group peptidase (beta-lactamase class C family)